MPGTGLAEVFCGISSLAYSDTPDADDNDSINKCQPNSLSCRHSAKQALQKVSFLDTNRNWGFFVEFTGRMEYNSGHEKTDTVPRSCSRPVPGPCFIERGAAAVPRLPS
jgi:hypothetical protein